MTTTEKTIPIIHQSDIIARLGEKLNNLPLEDIRLGVHHIFARMREALCDKQTISIRGFGTFTCQKQPERTFYDPRDGINKTLGARDVAKFKAGKMLQEKLSLNSN